MLCWQICGHHCYVFPGFPSPFHFPFTSPSARGSPWLQTVCLLPSCFSHLHPPPPSSLSFCSSPRTSSRAGGTHIAILARSLMYYLSVALQPKAADQLALKITEQTTKWICALFRCVGIFVWSLYSFLASTNSSSYHCYCLRVSLHCAPLLQPYTCMYI